MRRLISALAVAATLTTAPALAAERQTVFIGIGATTCQPFADGYRGNPPVLNMALDWAQGFMSATNYARYANGQPEKNLNAWTIDEQRAKLRSYCDQHPLSTVFDGVLELYNELPNYAGK